MQAHLVSTLDQFVAGIKRTLPPTTSVVLYGSAARNEHVQGWSDLNLMVVADELGPVTLDALSPAFELLQSVATAPPLLFTTAEWSRAADVFPIEVTDMLIHRRVLSGADPVAGAVVNGGDLRAALERDFRALLLRVRRGFAGHRQDQERIGRLMVRSTASATALMRATLSLTGAPVDGTTHDVIKHSSRIFSTDTTVVETLFNRRAPTDATASRSELERYLGFLSAAVTFLDHYPAGAER